MNALLTIKTELATSKPANDTSKTTPVNDNDGFSQALEKQVQDSSKAETGQQTRAQKIAGHQEHRDKAADKSEEAAVSASEDGKNLPPADNNEHKRTADESKLSDDPKAVVASAGQTETAAKTETDPDVDIASGETDADQQTPQKAAVSVAVAAPAIQNAATDKVTMTLSANAKAQPKPVTADSEASNKTLLQNLTPVINADGETVDGKVRFADILKKDAMQQTTIRADILQAISQKTSGENSDGQTLKTSLQNLLLGGEGKAQPNGPAAELIRQIQPGQQRSTDNRASASFLTALTPAANAPGQVSAASAPQIAMDVQPQLNSAAWSRVVSSRVVWMAREGIQQAELRLNPANLGSVDVRLNINNEQASVTFLAQNAATREALEQAMPRLRESLAENGLALTHSEVGQQDQPDQQATDDETGMKNTHLAQVSLALDDIEDEVNAEIQAEINEPPSGVSLYA